MNKTIESYAREQIIQGLKALPEANQRVFKLMYGRQGGKRSVEDAEKMSIEDCVAEVPAERTSLALDQVERTVKKESANAVR